VGDRARVSGSLLAPGLAAALALIALASGVSGVDLSAASYRVWLFRTDGFTLWDPGWYGGHWTLGYSVLFPPVGAALGIAATDVLCVAAASWAVDRLLVAHFGRRGRFGALLFALGTLAQVAVGRVPFVLGGTLALLALLCAQRRSAPRLAGWPLALLLAVAASLASPLAGGFLALAAFAWLLGGLPRWSLRAGALCAAALLPVVALTLLFGAGGRMPFATANLAGMLLALAAVGLLLAPHERTLRIAVVLYAVVLVACYVVPSAIGGNIVRLATSVGLGILICLPLRASRSRLLAAIAFVPLALGQFSPSAGALLGSSVRSSSPAFFAPLLAYLEPHDHPLGRIEVVPTAHHWEADYVARVLPLARGWERQLDTADNPIFYDRGRLRAGTYRAWLEQNGVRFVALADVPLDYAGKREAQLVRAGVPGLELVWRNANWRVYELSGASGILSGPGRLVSEQDTTLVLAAVRPGRLLVRVRSASDWHLRSGAASLSTPPGGGLAVQASRAGRIILTISP
jgi:hypothetical protein